MRSMLLLCVMLAASPLLCAADVYINGVKANGLTSQEFKNCTVTFDEKGIIHIAAPNVTIISDTGKEEKLIRQYFLAFTAPAKPHTKPIALYINGKPVESIKEGLSSALIELSKYLKKGANKITIMAQPETEPRTLQIIIGTGIYEGGNLKLSPAIDKPYTVGDQGLSETIELKAE